MEEFIPRPHYLDRILSGKDAPFIKIITGLRRSGKSVLMKMTMDSIISSGADASRTLMIYFDIDTPDTPHDHAALSEYVSSRLPMKKGSYLFLDEIQNVKDWEIAVSSFYASGMDVYITGSNSQMLSSDLSTKLSGRCIEICIRPLVFSEYIRFRKEIDDIQKLFMDFIHDGGLPAVALSEDTAAKSLIPEILSGIYNTVFVKDVLERYNIRSPSGLSNVSRFLMRNIGDRSSSRSTSNYLISSGQKINHITTEDYFGYLTASYLFSRSERIDSKSKEYLHTSDKFYCSDLGIRNATVPFRIDDIDGILENIVYNELLFRYSEVAVCAVGELEIDFITDPKETPRYFQVCTSIGDADTRERELAPLRRIDDNYEKCIITYERFLTEDIDGVRIVQITDWLLEGQ